MESRPEERLRKKLNSAYYPLPVSVSAVMSALVSTMKVAMITFIVPTMKTCVISAVIGITPVRRGTPVTASPHPMIVAPSPASTQPDVARRWTNRNSLHHRCGHRWWDDNRSGSHHYRGWQRNAKAYSHVNPCVYSSDSQTCQGQNCDYLFHMF